MCVESWYGFFSGGSSEGYWEGNIESQKLGINNFELLGAMSFILAGVISGSITAKDLGLASIPAIHNAAAPKLGGQKAHHEFLQSLLQGIASGKSILSQGVARAAEQLGPAARSVYDGIYPARGYMQHYVQNVGSALHWAMDARDPFNSCHDYLIFGTSPVVANHFDVPGGDLQAPRKTNVYDRAESLSAWVQTHQSLKNSIPICEWASMPVTFFHPPDMDIRIFESKILSAVTGVDYSVEKMWEAGDRIYMLRRAIAVLRENRIRRDDTISPVWFQKTVGGAQGLAAPLEEAKWETLKDSFYRLRGWDAKNGWPTRGALEQLGMRDVADKLQGADKLGVMA
jgi:aldehyde:ferredoxin oxidoreductase